MRIILLLLITASAHAQWTVDDELAYSVARVAANEASLSSATPADVALIWQITEARGSTNAERLAWLQRHSSCVLTDRPITERELRTNCVFSRHLRMDDEQPAGWPTNWVWASYREKWRLIHQLAFSLVRGTARVRRPCDQTPLTWGSPVLDAAHARRMGLVRVFCRGTLNAGFVRASDRS